MASLLNMSGGSLLNKGLPYDAEIEYLESTGTQWIDTNIIPDSTTVWVLDISFYKAGTFKHCGYLCDSYTRFMIGVNPNFVQFGTDKLYTTTIANDENRHTYIIDAPNKLFYMDGNVIGGYTSYKTYTQTLYLMARRLYSTPYIDSYVTGRFFGSSIIKNAQYVRDYIPVRRGTTGYMYDKVSGQLFGNSGTGNFILGQDIN